MDLSFEYSLGTERSKCAFAKPVGISLAELGSRDNAFDNVSSDQGRLPFVMKRLVRPLEPASEDKARRRVESIARLPAD